MTVDASKVQLWWPNGYGTQTLYDLTVSIGIDGNAADPSTTVTRKIGFRTASLVQESYEGQKGSSFYFVVNDVPIFAKGVNWIPADAFESRVTPQKLALLLQSCKEANMNMVRVWGGGIYQSNDFYEICDRMGLLVWQEFMFACAMYPVRDSFLDSVKQEVEHQVTRLMSHPSIIIWSGNNENEEALITGWYAETKKNPFLFAIDYHTLYHDTIMKTVNALDPTRPFISSSPSNGVISMAPFTERFVADEGASNDDFGDVHYYNYKDDGTLVSNFRNPRFMSEYGFQSMPCFRNLSRVSRKEDWHPTSKFMVHRNHHKFGQEEIMRQIRYQFGADDLVVEHPVWTCIEFERFCYLSQASQAICVRAQTEHYRRLRGTLHNCMGALFWQCNDIWQAPTWAAIEYNGDWKVLQYVAKEFFEAVLVSSFTNQDGEQEVHLINDLTEDIKGTVHITIYSYDSGVIVGETAVASSVSRLCAKQVCKFPIAEVVSKASLKLNEVFSIVKFVDESDRERSKNWYFPTSLSSLKAERHSFHVKISSASEEPSNKVSLTITTKKPVFYVWLEVDSFSTVSLGRFSTNGFHMLPGLPVSVTFKAWNTIQNKTNLLKLITIRCLTSTNKTSIIQ